MFDIELTKEYLETVVKEGTKKKSICKIEEIFVKSAVEEGNNFLGEVLRVKLKVVMGDGRQSTTSVIVKKAPANKLIKQFVMDKSAFCREIKMYSEVLPNMMNILDNSSHYIEPLWPECISVRTYNTILLQDLSLIGYRMMDRMTFMDLDTSIFVIQALARFHAISVVAKENFLLDPKDFNRYWFGESNKTMEDVFSRGLKSLAKVMKKNWGKEWSGMGNDMEVLADTFAQRLEKCVEINKPRFSTLNHCDPKIPNIMFKHCTISGALIGIRFLDFQSAYYGSFAVDLQFFFHNNIDPIVREKHYDELLIAYYKSLQKTFKLLNHEPTHLPPLTELKLEMKEYLFLGVVTACMMLNLTLVDKDDSTSLQEFVNENDDFNTTTYSSAVYNETMQKLLKPYLLSGIFKLYQ